MCGGDLQRERRGNCMGKKMKPKEWRKSIIILEEIIINKWDDLAIVLAKYDP